MPICTYMYTWVETEIVEIHSENDITCNVMSKHFYLSILKKWESLCSHVTLCGQIGCTANRNSNGCTTGRFIYYR